MSLLQLALFAVIQGVTEWLPVSSSGHLVLLSDAFGAGVREETLLNAMAHLGTLAAMLAYFRKDVWRAVRGGVALVGAAAGRGLGPDATLALHILATLPFGLAAGLAVAAMDGPLAQSLRSPYTVAATTVVFGAALWWADVAGSTHRGERDRTLWDAVLIGSSQAVAALLPGTSRSGITMTVARARGFGRTESARFSMLIGAPLLAAVGAYGLLELATAGDMAAEAGAGPAVTLADGLFVAALSAVTGFASIWALMALLGRISFLPFVIYRFALGGLILLLSPLGLGLLAAQG